MYIVEHRAICGSRRTTLHGMEYPSNMRKFYNQFASIVYCRSMIGGSIGRSERAIYMYIVLLVYHKTVAHFKAKMCQCVN